MKYSKLLNTKSRKSRVAKTIATIATALSVAVVVIASLVCDGFRSEIDRKTVEIMDFVHVRELNQIFVESASMTVDSAVINDIDSIIAPQKVEKVIESSVILMSGSNVVPSVLKNDFSGKISSGEIELSASAAKLLAVEKGQTIEVMTMQEGEQIRREMKVAGIYSSGMSDIEVMVARASMGDLREISKLNENEVSYLAIHGVTPIEPLIEYVDNNGLDAQTVYDRAAHIYGWLSMIDNNLSLVLIIMIVVAVINVVTSTLIVMLDNTKVVATLRALGMNRPMITRIFLYGIGRNALKGVVIGLILGVAFGVVQSSMALISLDEEAYFLSSVPISFVWYKIVGCAVLMALAVAVSLLIPINIVTRLNIASALKYQ